MTTDQPSPASMRAALVISHKIYDGKTVVNPFGQTEMARIIDEELKMYKIVKCLRYFAEECSPTKCPCVTCQLLNHLTK